MRKERTKGKIDRNKQIEDAAEETTKAKRQRYKQREEGKQIKAKK